MSPARCHPSEPHPTAPTPGRSIPWAEGIQAGRGTGHIWVCRWGELPALSHWARGAANPKNNLGWGIGDTRPGQPSEWKPRGQKELSGLLDVPSLHFVSFEEVAPFLSAQEPLQSLFFQRHRKSLWILQSRVLPTQRAANRSSCEPKLLQKHSQSPPFFKMGTQKPGLANLHLAGPRVLLQQVRAPLTNATSDFSNSSLPPAYGI